MAIVKMQKFNMITFYEHQEIMLEKFQDFQEVELFSADGYYQEPNSLFSQMAIHPKEEEIELQMGQVAWARNFLKPYLPAKGMLEAFKEPLQRYTLSQLSAHAQKYDWKKIHDRLRVIDKRLRVLEQDRRELSAQEDELNIWRYFDEQPTVLTSFQQAVGLLGTVPNTELAQLKQELEKTPTTYLEVVHQTANTSYLLILCHKDNRQKAVNLLRKSGFEEYQYPFKGKPAQDLLQIKEQAQALNVEAAALKEELKAMKEDYQALGLIAEYLDGLFIRVQSNQYLLQSNYTVNLAGWVPVDKANRLIKQIESAVGEEYFIEFQEVTEEDIDDVPILLNNNALVKPFEGLVEMYNLPKYNELDPTPFMAPFYAVAFGMMVADFGYGLLLFLAITIGKKVFNFKPGLLKNLNMFQLLAVPTMIWGLIYGNIFGFEFSFQLLSASQDITEILMISVIFGYLQIMFALILKFYVLWQKKDEKVKAVFQSGSWMLFLISAAVLVLGMMVLTEGPLQQIGLFGIIASLVLIVFGGSLNGTTLAGKFGSGLYSLMDITNYLGDLISYTRLMALGVAGGSIAAAFNLIIGYLPPVARFTVGILLFIVLHGLNIFLSYLSAYVHGIRLQYLEFFGKFFTGGGRAFKPIKSSEQYVEVLSEEKQQQGEK